MLRKPRVDRGEALTVGDVMAWPAIAIDPAQSAEDALIRMRACGIEHLLVERGRVALGILCERDAESARRVRQVADVMRAAAFVSPFDGATRVAEILRASHACAAVVCVGGRACGLVTRGDLIRAEVGGRWPRCGSCRSHHRVRVKRSAGVGFCEACLDSVEPFEFEELYVDLGVGDG
jgi:CBS domain-containing protein